MALASASRLHTAQSAICLDLTDEPRLKASHPHFLTSLGRSRFLGGRLGSQRGGQPAAGTPNFIEGKALLQHWSPLRCSSKAPHWRWQGGKAPRWGRLQVACSEGSTGQVCIERDALCVDGLSIPNSPPASPKETLQQQSAPDQAESTEGGNNWQALVGLLFALCFLTAADKGVMSLAPMTMAQEFGWAEADKGLVGSAFFIGFMLSQISGGLVQHKVGSKKLLLAGLIWFSACSLLTPLAANHSLLALLAARVLLGIGEGVTVPILTSMLAEQVPAESRSKSLALVFSGGTLGTVAALLACPSLMATTGWQSLYWLVGAGTAAWSVAWATFAPQDKPKKAKSTGLAPIKTPRAPVSPPHSAPSSPHKRGGPFQSEDSPPVSPLGSPAMRSRRWRLAAQPDTLQWSIGVLRRRVSGLSTKAALRSPLNKGGGPPSFSPAPEAQVLGGGGTKRQRGGPVRTAMTLAGGVKNWVLVHTGREAAVVKEAEEDVIPWGDFVRCRALWAVAGAHFCSSWSWSVMMTWIPAYFTSHLGASLASSSLLTLGPWCACFAAGNLSGWLADWLSSTGMNKTQVRKLMNGVSFLGPAVCLGFLSKVNTIPEAVLLLSATLALGSFSSGGFLSNHADISPRHAGLLFAVTNTVGCLAGVTSVTLTGMVLDQLHDWTLVWLGTAAMYVIGTAWYTWLADTEKLFD